MAHRSHADAGACYDGEAAGKYAWAELYRAEVPSAEQLRGNSSRLPPPTASSSSSFCRCDISLQPQPGARGRGLVLGEKAAEGELLMAVKAFALAPAGAALCERALDRLRSCPEDEHDRFFLLYDGETKEMDTKMQALSNCRAWLSSGEAKPTSSRRKVDAKRVERILRFNTIARDTLSVHGVADEAEICGVWLLPSFLNHSCRPNVQLTFVSDLLVCRAAGPLPAGTELLCSYVSTFQPMYIRRERLQADFGFVCHCERCTIEEALLAPDFAKRTLEKLDALVDQIAMQELRKTADALDKLCAETEQKVKKAASTGVATLRSKGGALHDACAKLWGPFRESDYAGVLCPRLELLLCGSFVAVFKGAAFCWMRLQESLRCTQAYGRCCDLLEEVGRGGAYHAHWASVRALQFFKADASAPDVAIHAGYALRWHRACYGGDDEVFRLFAGQAGWPEELLAHARRRSEDVVPASWDYSLEETEQGFTVSIVLPDGIQPTDVELDLSARSVVATCGKNCGDVAAKLGTLRISLQRAVDADRAPPGKFKKKDRRLLLQLPFA